MGAGGYKDSLAFGVKFSDGTIWMATDNIRRDFFNNDEPYINTRANQVGSWNSYSITRYTNIYKHTKVFSYSDNGNVSRINPFIYNK